ncbi:MAG: hypothetical protein EA423_10250 [Phycisphaerales bacterium]|nr:MAG: hypothetical protein EA423_10250 [Phycisphaerales bacterium]
MTLRSMLPLIDLGFLTLGAVVAILSQTTRIDAMPVDLAEVGPGVTSAVSDNPPVVTVRADGVFLGDRPIGRGELALLLDPSETVLVRADREATSGRLLGVLAEITAAGVDARLEVQQEEGAR